MNYEKSFQDSSRPHILMITNHGIHQWKIVPGLPDTGGQNVFVNQFTHSLAKQGYRITIVNRGGYNHPITGEPRTGVHYKDENQRILYLEDNMNAFVRKEDMDPKLPLLVKNLQNHIETEGIKVDRIFSHYWDGAKLGLLYNRTLPTPITHIWVPHSLGTIKKRNVKPIRWADLNIDERIVNEKLILQTIDGVAATSNIIAQSLLDDYVYLKKPLFLPPCVDPERFYPHHIRQDHAIRQFLGERCNLSIDEITQSQIITEISRTDKTKRKDVLIKAFAEILPKHPNTLLVTSIDRNEEGLSSELMALIRKLGIEKSVAVLGSVWDELPDIYALTDIYCTPSIMEGFGMTSQEAAATGVPVVASDLVPFAVEYLLGDHVDEVTYEDGVNPIKRGEGVVVVPADEIKAFTDALDQLLSNPELRKRMGEKAYQITIPYFTWKNVVTRFLADVKEIEAIEVGK